MMLSFVRNLIKSPVIYVLRRLLAELLPLRPYGACGKDAHCPCPAASGGCVTGIAVGDAVTLNMRRRDGTAQLVEFPRKEGAYARLSQSGT